MLSTRYIINVVDDLEARYHTRDPYELCDMLGIRIRRINLEKKAQRFFLLPVAHPKHCDRHQCE